MATKAITGNGYINLNFEDIDKFGYNIEVKDILKYIDINFIYFIGENNYIVKNIFIQNKKFLIFI